MHLTFSLLGSYIQSEVHSANGRCDTLVQTDKYIFALEFKLDKTAEEDLQQIEIKEYLAPFMLSPQQKIAVGINFSSEHKKVENYLVTGK